MQYRRERLMVPMVVISTLMAIFFLLWVYEIAVSKPHLKAEVEKKDGEIEKKDAKYGDLEDIEIKLGLKTEREHPYRGPFSGEQEEAELVPHEGDTAGERKARQKTKAKRKQAKKSRKVNRKKKKKKR